MNTLLLFTYIICLSLAAGYILPLAFFGAGLRGAIKNRTHRTVSDGCVAGTGSEKVTDESFQPFVSVVIACRNEEKYIGACLQSILNSTYPRDRFEIIVVDDGSTDATRLVAESFSSQPDSQMRVRVIPVPVAVPHTPGEDSRRLQGSKKIALSHGIEQSCGTIIALTDADCRVPPEWLDLIVGTFDARTGLVAGPVVFDRDNSAFSKIVALEFVGLVGVHAGSIYAGWPASCSGANLAFRREAFEDVGGYRGLEHVASGDDEMLMFRIDASPFWDVRYCASAVATVHTRAPKNVKSFLRQRIRWASKVGHYESSLVSMLHMAAYLFVLSIPVILIAAFWNSVFWPLLFLMLAAKIGAERMVLSPATHFFDCRSLMRYHVPTQPFQIVYILWVGMVALCGGVEWKSRMMER